MDWFTSDLHLGHRLMVDMERAYSPWRIGYESVEDMDRGILEQINRFVKPEDTLYILGDMSFHKPQRTAELLSVMHGRKVLVKGNHDHRKENKEGARLPVAVDIELAEFHHYLERKFTVTPEGPAQLIVMFHFPIMHWHKQQHGSWHLHGHLHGNPSGVPGKILDVGWDKWGRPLSLREITDIMVTKRLRGNHHEERLLTM